MLPDLRFIVTQGRERSETGDNDRQFQNCLKQSVQSVRRTHPSATSIRKKNGGIAVYTEMPPLIIFTLKKSSLHYRRN